MKERVERRLGALKAEHEAYETKLAELEAEKAEIHAAQERLDTIIEVLEELLADDGDSDSAESDSQDEVIGILTTEADNDDSADDDTSDDVGDSVDVGTTDTADENGTTETETDEESARTVPSYGSTTWASSSSLSSNF